MTRKENGSQDQAGSGRGGEEAAAQETDRWVALPERGASGREVLQPRSSAGRRGYASRAGERAGREAAAAGGGEEARRREADARAPAPASVPLAGAPRSGRLLCLRHGTAALASRLPGLESSLHLPVEGRGAEPRRLPGRASAPRRGDDTRG